MKKHIDWIDALKGIGIILVVLGHTPISRGFYLYIFSYHMPLFFFISGYLLSVHKYPNFFPFLISKVKTLIIPYIFFGIVSIFIMYTTSPAPSFKANLNIMSILKQYILSKRNHIPGNIPLWFLTSLFTVYIMYYLLRKYIKNDFVLIGLILYLAGVGFIAYKTTGSQHTLIWSFDTSIYYMLFFAIGNLLNRKTTYKHGKLLLEIGLSINIAVFIFPNILSIIYSAKLGYIQQLYVYLIRNIITLFEIFAVIYLAQLLSSNKILNFLGRNSIIILALHEPVGFYLFNRFINLINLDISSHHNLLGIVQATFTLIVLVPFILMLSRYLPFFIGKKWRFSFTDSSKA